MNQTLKIGTRDSKLAVWQAELVQGRLEKVGIASQLVFIKSPADRDLETPLHQFGNVGIFTKMLDDALLNGDVDIAVHSLKDYPTQPIEGIALAAVVERGDYRDIIVTKGRYDFLKDSVSKATIATGSIRRKAQWLLRYPNHAITGLRGNVQTRLSKLENNDWDGAIFAKAGLERVKILPTNHQVLDWMIPAPAQGVIGITCRSEETDVIESLQNINHSETALTSKIERDFLKIMEGGCSAPIGALAVQKDDNILLSAGVFSVDGNNSATVEIEAHISIADNLGIEAAQQCLESGGESIMQEIKDAN